MYLLYFCFVNKFICTISLLKKIFFECTRSWLRHVGSSSPTGDWTPGPLHWECEVLATGPPRKCLYHFLASTYKWYRMISIFLCELSLKFPVEVQHSSYVRLRRVTEVDALQGSTPSRKGVLPKWVLILRFFFPEAKFSDVMPEVAGYWWKKL